MAFNDLTLSLEGARVLLTAAELHLLYLEDVKKYKPSKGYITYTPDEYTPKEVEQAKEDYERLYALTECLKAMIDKYNTVLTDNKRR